LRLVVPLTSSVPLSVSSRWLWLLALTLWLRVSPLLGAF
jgi:hypothetical protein